MSDFHLSVVGLGAAGGGVLISWWGNCHYCSFLLYGGAIVGIIGLLFFSVFLGPALRRPRHPRPKGGERE